MTPDDRVCLGLQGVSANPAQTQKDMDGFWGYIHTVLDAEWREDFMVQVLSPRQRRKYELACQGIKPFFDQLQDMRKEGYVFCPIPPNLFKSRLYEWDKYATMFHMTNDSGLFRTRQAMEEEEGAYPVEGNRWRSAAGDWVPLYAGRMIHQFDHRAASVEVNPNNVHNAALSSEVTTEQKADPTFSPTPQYWVPVSEVTYPPGLEWLLCFRDIARATDVRTMIAAAVPLAGLGNTAPAMVPDDVEAYRAHERSLP